MLHSFINLIPKFITLDEMSFCVHQSMKYVVSAKSVMYNLITTNQIHRKQDIISVKSNLHLGIFYAYLREMTEMGFTLKMV